MAMLHSTVAQVSWHSCEIHCHQLTDSYTTSGGQDLPFDGPFGTGLVSSPGESGDECADVEQQSNHHHPNGGTEASHVSGGNTAKKEKTNPGVTIGWEPSTFMIFAWTRVTSPSSRPH